MQQFVDFRLDFLEQRVEKALHEAVGEFDAGGAFLDQLLLLRFIFVIGSDDLLQHRSAQVFAHVTELQPGLNTPIELPLKHLKMLQNVQSGRRVLVVALRQLRAEEFFEELLEVLIHELAAPLASAA